MQAMMLDYGLMKEWLVLSSTHDTVLRLQYACSEVGVVLLGVMNVLSIRKGRMHIHHPAMLGAR